MPTSRTFSYEYNFAVDSVFALLKDADFLRRRGEAAGDRNVEIEIAEDRAGVHLKIARERTIELPDFVKGLLSPTNRAVESTTWRAVDDGFVATYEIEVSGLPGKVRGQSKLVPTQNGCQYESNFEVTARFPLIGRKIESLLAQGFEEQLSLNAARNAEELRKSS